MGIAAARGISVNGAEDPIDEGIDDTWDGTGVAVIPAGVDEAVAVDSAGLLAGQVVEVAVTV